MPGSRQSEEPQSRRRCVVPAVKVFCVEGELSVMRIELSEGNAALKCAQEAL